jgi:hypothetical protein
MFEQTSHPQPFQLFGLLTPRFWFVCQARFTAAITRNTESMGAIGRHAKFFIFLQESNMLYNALRIVSDSLAGRGQALMT